MNEELIQSLQERIDELKKFAHVDTAVDLRTWCLKYGDHTSDCEVITQGRYYLQPLECTCGWDDIVEKLTKFSDEFYEKFRKEK